MRRPVTTITLTLLALMACDLELSQLSETSGQGGGAIAVGGGGVLQGGGSAAGGDEAAGGSIPARQPGPHPEEYGLVTFWELSASSELSYMNCSDHRDWRPVEAVPQPKDPNKPGSTPIVPYVVLPGGQVAEGQKNCTLSGANCETSTNVYQVDDHTLTTSGLLPGIQHDDGNSCIVRRGHSVVIVDGGEVGTAHVVHTYIPDSIMNDCAALDESIKAVSPNGKGLLECVVQYDLTLSFMYAVPPS